MVYIISWDEFVERSVQLFRADPESVRFFNLLNFLFVAENFVGKLFLMQYFVRTMPVVVFNDLLALALLVY